jgi:diguanylate cyclase
MTILIDLAFLLLAAIGGAAIAGLVAWVRGQLWAARHEEAAANFARITLSRLQDLTRRVAAEVDQHTEAVEEINAVLSSEENDEASVVAAVSQLIEVNQRMKRQLDSAEQRLEAQAAQIESTAAAARTDPLTQLANRRAMDEELARCVADFSRRGTPATVMLLDVDHFKRFNDTHGHQAGDAALVTVARTLRSAIGDLGLVARWGGEEFAVVLAGRTVAESSVLCEQARQAVSSTPVRWSRSELHLTASAGVAEILPREAEEDCLGRADLGLYASKNAGRNCGHFHDGRVCRLLRLPSSSAVSLSSAGSSGRANAAAGASSRAADARVGREGGASGSLPGSLAAAKVGDEWLFEAAEISTDALYREPLANIDSRPTFFDDMIRRLGQLRRGGPPVTLLLVQVDGYARIVSDHGPTRADVVLRITSQFINASLRDMDHVCRLSEDTFAVLLPGAVINDGSAIAEHLRKAVERCQLPRTAGVNYFTVSAGVVEAGRQEDLRQLLERGRAALAEAVTQGRNCVVTRPVLAPSSRQPAAVPAH